LLIHFRWRTQVDISSQGNERRFLMMASISIEEGPKLAFLVRGMKGGTNGDISLKLKAWEKRVVYI
jgi:hypothetical protein